MPKSTPGETINPDQMPENNCCVCCVELRAEILDSKQKYERLYQGYTDLYEKFEVHISTSDFREYDANKNIQEIRNKVDDINHAQIFTIGSYEQERTQFHKAHNALFDRVTTIEKEKLGAMPYASRTSSHEVRRG